MTSVHPHTDQRAGTGEPPASGAWDPSHGAGDRLFARIGDLALESGAVLPQVTLAYETWGELSPRGDNAVLVLHALTGDSHVRGPASTAHATAGWWEDLIGPGRPVDTDRYFVVAPNVLGGCQGSTGPASLAPDGRRWASRFPDLTVRDQVAAEAALMAQLGLERWALVIGGSMGGMRALEWAATLPGAVERLAVIASGARASADQIAWNSAQLAAIEADGGFLGGEYYDQPDGAGPHRGLGVARRIAHTTYRTAYELEERFGNRLQPHPDGGVQEGYPQVTSYLDHHAAKLSRRFDANSYRVLVRAMNSHDLGRGRGGTAAGLGRITARTLVVAIESDRLFPLPLVEEIRDGVPGSTWRVESSPIGHDAFLVTNPHLERWITHLLEDG
ncbi:homoserine O-acetyltransferase MetX [Brachybacterium hainanense]|uniref:Homoserine O-acetyltransferase n=1 Tax=Brachybacterium hainanense TaxID=1541174 RepID=A0ABV6RG72_9MICO